MKRAVLATVLAIAGCGSSTPSADPSGTSNVPFALRVTYQQVRAPEDRFRQTPIMVLTADGVLFKPMPASPMPLIEPVTQARLSEAGFDRIVEQARTRGLLNGDGDFIAPATEEFAQTILIELLVDGGLRELRGDQAAGIQCVTQPCDPAPGSAEAFGAFQHEDLASILDEELGPPTPYDPEGYGVLIRGDEVVDPGVDRDIRPWPLDAPMTKIGVPTAEGSSLRCLTVRGEEAAEVRAAFAGATELTFWVDEGRDLSEAIRVDVRALLPGDGNPCLELFGVEG